MRRYENITFPVDLWLTKLSSAAAWISVMLKVILALDREENICFYSNRDNVRKSAKQTSIF